MTAPLPQGEGYGIIVGVGLAFAAGMIATTYALRRYQRERITSEEFGTAGRSVQSGLIACAVVSSWTWAATLMMSSTQAYNYGVSGPLWYGVSGSVLIFLFATITIEIKRKAPGCHTYLELIHARFGRGPHAVMMFYAFATNILVTAMLLAGGSATVTTLSGMPEVAANFLIVLPVTIYTLFGGLKATFLTDYVHTIILIIIIFVFVFNTYTTNSYLGSTSRMYDLLVEAAQQNPVAGNQDGSYLTIRSRPGGIFFVISTASNFGTVFNDQGYWNKAIAASPKAALPGYVLGGLAWFAVPFLCATTMGLAARVLEPTPMWPTYPRRMTAAEVAAGIPLPNAAVALMGRPGGAIALLMLFMAVTSAASAEMVAASSIWTYDIYRPYINPRASGKQLIFMTHLGVVVFILVMIGFSIGVYHGGISMGYLYSIMGIIIGSAVIPAVLTIFWSGLNRLSITVTPPLGMIFGIASWLGSTGGLYSQITVDTTGENYPVLIGNVVSVCSPIIIIPICQLISGHAHYDFDSLKEYQVDVEETSDIPVSDTPVSPDSDPVQKQKTSTAIDIERSASSEMTEARERKHAAKVKLDQEWVHEETMLTRYAWIARSICLFVVIAMVILWPIPMYGSKYVFSKPFFRGWVVIGIIWLWASFFIVAVLPIWQGRAAIAHTFRGIWWDISGQSHKLREWQDENPEQLHAVISPVVLSGVELSTEHNEQTGKAVGKEFGVHLVQGPPN